MTRVDGDEFIRQIKMAPGFVILKDGKRELQLHVKNTNDEITSFLGPDFTIMSEVAVASFMEAVKETLRNPAIEQNRLL